MIKWIRTSRLSIKNSLSLQAGGVDDVRESLTLNLKAVEAGDLEAQDYESRLTTMSQGSQPSH